MTRRGAGGDAPRGADARLFACLLAREISPRFGLVLGAFAVVGAVAATNAGTWAAASPVDPFTRLARRFDLVAVAAAAALAVVRAAARIGEDHATGWLVPWFAGQGGRIRYAFGVAAAVSCGAGLLLSAGAVPFALTAAGTGAPDMVRALPRLLGGGLLLIGALATYTVLVGVVARTPAATILAAAAMAVAPYIVAAAYLPGLGTEPSPGWLRAWLVAAPPLAPARDWAESAHQLAFVTGMAAALAVTARVRAGRRT